MISAGQQLVEEVKIWTRMGHFHVLKQYFETAYVKRFPRCSEKLVNYEHWNTYLIQLRVFWQVLVLFLILLTVQSSPQDGYFLQQRYKASLASLSPITLHCLPVKLEDGMLSSFGFPHLGQNSSKTVSLSCSYCIEAWRNTVVSLE